MTCLKEAQTPLSSLAGDSAGKIFVCLRLLFVRSMPPDFAFQVSSFSVVVTATATGEFEKLHVGKMSCTEEMTQTLCRPQWSQ